MQALLFGGTSDERWVSVATAQNLASHIPNAELWFWDMNDHIQKVTHEELASHRDPFTKDFLPQNARDLGELQTFFADQKSNHWVVILGLHGGRGENGWIQKILENHHIPYIGSSSSVSEICLDKKKAKEIVRKAGGKVADDIVFSATDSNFFVPLKSFFEKHGHIVIKPVDEGSSRGLYIIHDQAQFQQAVEAIKKTKLRYIAEEFIKGRELTIGVANLQGKITVLPCSEAILLAGGSFDYEGKYLGKGTKEITPAEITEYEKNSAQSLVLLAHKALGCSGCTRSEVMFNEKGFYYLETNTLPGMTKASFIPQQLEAAGVTMRDFLNSLIEEAVARH